MRRLPITSTKDTTRILVGHRSGDGDGPVSDSKPAARALETCFASQGRCFILSKRRRFLRERQGGGRIAAMLPECASQNSFLIPTSGEPRVSSGAEVKNFDEGENAKN